MRPKSYFIGLRDPQHQQQVTMCVPACIKTILDNQFKNLPHKIPLREINATLCDEPPREYTRSREYIPKGVEETKSSLQKLLKDYDIIVVDKADMSKNNLLDLILSGIYPMVYLNFEDYFPYRGGRIRTDGGDSFLYHCVIVIGYNEIKEEFSLWDPLDKREKKDYSVNEVRCITYKKFLRSWDKTKSRVIYLFEKSKQKTLPYFNEIK